MSLPASAFLHAPPSWRRNGSNSLRNSASSDNSASSSLSANSKRPLVRSSSLTLTSLRSLTSERFALFGDAADHDPDSFLDDGDPEGIHTFTQAELQSLHALDARGSLVTARGLRNLGTLLLLALAVLLLFAGYPTLEVLRMKAPGDVGAFNLGGVNASGQVPQMSGNFGLIDEDTPRDALTHTSLQTGEVWELVFSDEFNQDGRTFWPGDDPYWEAEDLHYWQTNNLEASTYQWYTPTQLETANGSLIITLDKRPHRGLDYVGGLLTTWSKFCFTGGYVEVSVRLPGRADVYGLWPAAWTMGNLGRAGYGGTLEGMWPYSYDSCDVGTLANQTLNGLPLAAKTSGAEGEPGNGALSFLPGQRLSRCTCPDDETHPGPKNTDGSFRGRSAPEIDIIEAQVDSTTLIGHVSQSAQWAPFNAGYNWDNSSANLIIDNKDVSLLNPYQGGVFQQATSVVSTTNQNCYEYASGLSAEPCFSTYGFEYRPGTDGYIQWVNDGTSAWTLKGPGMAADPEVEIGDRPIPNEPMYLLLNLGLSLNFGAIDYEGLDALWPVHMYVDSVRVYQPANAKNIGCDPPDAPTEAYIQRYIHAYTDPNITTWDQMTDGAPLPRNRLIDTC